nr:unnamed protein product [Digitaria exilis]
MWLVLKSCVAAMRSASLTLTIGFWKSETGANRLCAARSLSAHQLPSSTAAAPDSLPPRLWRRRPPLPFPARSSDAAAPKTPAAMTMPRPALPSPWPQREETGRPQRPEFPEKESLPKFAPSWGGIWPSSLFPDRSSDLSRSRRAREEGIWPESWLPESLSELRKWQLASSAGSGPVSWLEERSRVTRKGSQSQRPGGIGPVRALSERSTVVAARQYWRAEGREPWRPKPERESEMTRAS